MSVGAHVSRYRDTPIISSELNNCNLNKPSVAEFFSKKCILITGATGFVGKTLIEKILRSCPEVDTMYLLMRAKRGVEAQQRLEQLINNKLFERVLAERDQASRLDQFRVVEGDISLPGLGISDNDRAELCRRVQVVFHVAATVKFDEPLKVALFMNTRGTRELLNLTKDMTNLKAVVHTSTFFSNCEKTDILEEIYPTSVDPERLIQCAEWMDNKLLDAMTPVLLDGRPNTYVFTKHLAEKLVADAGKTLPIAIFRPSIVMSTLNEPEPGWLENLNGPSGVIAAGGSSIVRGIYCDYESTPHVAPVDLCVNLMLSIAWYIANFRPAECEVFNFTTPKENNFKWQLFEDKMHLFFKEYPFSTGLGIFKFWVTYSKPWMYVLQIYALFWAYLADLFSVLMGQKKRMVRFCKNATDSAWRLQFFTTNRWNVDNENVYRLLKILNIKDAATFNFDMRNIDWDKYVLDYCFSVRRHIMKEDDSTAPAARRRVTRMRLMNYFTLGVILILVYQCFLAPASELTTLGVPSNVTLEV